MILKSGTFFMWLNTFVKSAGFLILTPIILINYNQEGIYFWYLISTLSGIILLLDLGLNQACTRLISYAYGGAGLKEISNINFDKNRSQETNWKIVYLLYKSARKIYEKSSILICVFFLLTVSIYNKFIDVDIFTIKNIAFSISIIGNSIFLYSNSAACLLQGTGNLVIVQKVQCAISFLSTSTAIIITLFNLGVSETIIGFYLWWFLYPLIYKEVIKKHKTYNIQLSKKKRFLFLYIN